MLILNDRSRLWDAAKKSSNLFDIRHRVCTQKLDKPLLAPGQRIIASLGTHMGSKYRHSLIDLITDNGHVRTLGIRILIIARID